LWSFLAVKIVTYPHPALCRPAKLLKTVDGELRRMVAEMFALMYEKRGVGLAGNQVDLPYRLFIINLESDPAAKEHEHVFINPVITKRNGLAEAEEGCLSFPEIWAPVRRAEKITVTAYNLKGEELRYDLDGLFARAVQHETDHLDGIVFIDRLSDSSRTTVKKPLADLERQFEDDRARGIIPDDREIAARLVELERLRA
jgi:peptide deformylase